MVDANRATLDSNKALTVAVNALLAKKPADPPQRRPLDRQTVRDCWPDGFCSPPKDLYSHQREYRQPWEHGPARDFRGQAPYGQAPRHMMGWDTPLLRRALSSLRGHRGSTQAFPHHCQPAIFRSTVVRSTGYLPPQQAIFRLRGDYHQGAVKQDGQQRRAGLHQSAHSHCQSETLETKADPLP